jgi:predicted MFS family arabinose efflux permease
VLFIVLAVLFLAPDPKRDRRTRLDVAGATTVTGGLLVFVYALHHASTHGWLAGSTLALFGAAAGLFVAFVRIEARSAAPLVPASILRNRSLVAANVTAFLAYGALFSFIFLGSLLMQQALGYSPTKTGLAWLATTITSFLFAVLSGRLIAVVGARWLLVTGLLLVTAGALWLARIPADGGYLSGLLPAFLLVGIGFGFCGPTLQIGALAGVSESVAGLASGLVETMREVGGAAGVAAVSTVLVSVTGLGGFHAAFAFIGILAAVGIVTAAAGLRSERG